MEIDLFTTSAQIVNFLVLVLLLKRFLYKPIVRTMDRRENEIAERVYEARIREKKAKREARISREKRQELEDRRAEILAHAQDEAEAWKREAMRQARDEIREAKARWHKAIEREKQSFFKDLRRRMGEEVCRVSRQALDDMAGEDLERHMIEIFLKRLEGIEAEDWSRLAAVAAGPEQGVAVLTAFPIDEGVSSRIKTVVEAKLKRHADARAEPVRDGIRVRFEVSPDLICGIELRAGGWRAAWSIQSYLEAMEERLAWSFAGSSPE
ncbi:MAG: hypothetical protein IBX61_03175 [Thermoleophilia bacterium]|nr:hypothetical protein [Thermoleophilia bacterium]